MLEKCLPYQKPSFFLHYPPKQKSEGLISLSIFFCDEGFLLFLHFFLSFPTFFSNFHCSKNRTTSKKSVEYKGFSSISLVLQNTYKCKQNAKKKKSVRGYLPTWAYESFGTKMLLTRKKKFYSKLLLIELEYKGLNLTKD